MRGRRRRRMRRTCRARRAARDGAAPEGSRGLGDQAEWRPGEQVQQQARSQLDRRDGPLVRRRPGGAAGHRGFARQRPRHLVQRRRPCRRARQRRGVAAEDQGPDPDHHRRRARTTSPTPTASRRSKPSTTRRSSTGGKTTCSTSAHSGRRTRARTGRLASNWLNWMTRNDQNAAKMFKGAECTLCKDASWHIQKKKIDGGSTSRNRD